MHTRESSVGGRRGIEEAVGSQAMKRSGILSSRMLWAWLVHVYKSKKRAEHPAMFGTAVSFPLAMK
jgi:hypothetical protein